MDFHDYSLLSTGLSADAEVDELIRKTCGDADVFVYVCNGTSTLEEPVKKFLEHVNHQLPNLSKNLFILFNHWDQVVDEDEDSDSDDSDGDDAVTKQDSESVKEQHLQKVHKFLVQGLKADAVLDRTFFVSGKEVCKAQENEKKGKPSADCKVLKRKWQERWTEFRRFESMLHEFLSGSAIRTKCGRHWESCTEFMRQLIAMIEQFKQWLHGEVYKLNEKVKYKKSLLMKIDDSERKLQRMSSEKVQSAMEEFGGVFDKLYEKMKEDLRGKVEVYRDRLDKEKWSDYQKGMIEDLDKGMKDLMQPLEQQMRTFAMDKLKPLQESYAKLTISIDESHAQGEQESLSLEQPTCTDMTKRYRARPWLGREVLDTSVAMLCEYFWEPDGSAKTEVITVDGEEHVVQKRDQHSLGADISVASYLIGVSTLFPPLGVLTLSAFGLDWAADDDKLHREQVKGKIIKRLRKQLDARKQTVKSQCMDNLQSRLESQVKYFNAAVTDRKKVLKEQIHNMQQRIAERHTWIAKATNHLDQLQQEVKPCLDRFYTMYLQGESA